jgi:hypothetical protein
MQWYATETMKATVNSDIGEEVFDDMRAENKVPAASAGRAARRACTDGPERRHKKAAAVSNNCHQCR